MIDVHLSRELLEAVANGLLPPEALHRLALEHTLTVSEEAAAELAKWHEQDQRQNTLEFTPENYDDAFARAEQKARQVAGEIAADASRLEVNLAHLLSLAAVDRPAAVRADPRRFGSPWLAERLLAQARTLLAERPNEARFTARAAFWVAHQLTLGNPKPPVSALQRELVVRAQALEAAADRARGELSAAVRAFAVLREVRARGELGSDPLAEAEISGHEAAVHRDLGQMEEAETLLLEALVILDAIGARAEELETRYQLAVVLWWGNHREEALEVLAPVADEQATEADPATLVKARLLLAEILAEGTARGEREAALAWVVSCRPLVAGSPTAAAVLALVHGIVLARQGFPKEAAARLRTARQGLLAVGATALAARALVELVRADPASAREVGVTLTRLASQASAAQLAATLRTVASEIRRSAGSDQALLADASAFFAAAHESPGLPFRRPFPGARPGTAS